MASSHSQRTSDNDQVNLARLLPILIASPNQAADELLLEALDLGCDSESALALGALVRRGTETGMMGVIERYERLDTRLREHVISNIGQFHHALRRCGAADQIQRRLTALRLIAQGRQGKLAYVLSENLHAPDERCCAAAAEAMLQLAQWIAGMTRQLQDGGDAALLRQISKERPEIEAAVVRAMDVHRGKQSALLLQAALLLCDSPHSRTFAILHTGRHAGQSQMVRRLQQPPTPDQVDAFLLAASHGGLRSHFGTVFSRIEEAPVLDGLLRRTHWLKDQQMQLCLRQVSRGAWLTESELLRDLPRRGPEQTARIGRWIGCCGVHEGVQDERLEKLLTHQPDDFSLRLSLLRVALERPRGGSVQLLRTMLQDPDERLARMAARDIIRRKPQEYENWLLGLMSGAADSVRRVISRSIGQAGFEQLWERWEVLDKPTRCQAGKALLKLLPETKRRILRRLAGGPPQQKLRAMRMVQDLDLATDARELLVQLTGDANARLRSKAVHILGHLSDQPSDALVERAISDSDPRVRANAIEVLEKRGDLRFLPLLNERARSSFSRERANAIKAMHHMKVGVAGKHLMLMLRDPRGEHRISAMWALRATGLWQLLAEVGRVAKSDQDMRVRRYALGILKSVADLAKQQRQAAG